MKPGIVLHAPIRSGPNCSCAIKGDVKEQFRKLMSMVTLVVSKPEKLDTVIYEVKALGAASTLAGWEKQLLPFRLSQKRPVKTS